jgi:HEAT repeat protein
MTPFESTKKRRDALSALLTDPCEEVRTAAAEALERLEGIGSLSEVLEALKKGDLGTRVRCLYALGRIGGEEVLPALLYCASRPEEDIRSVAVEVLGDLSFPARWPFSRSD